MGKPPDSVRSLRALASLILLAAVLTACRATTVQPPTATLPPAKTATSAPTQTLPPTYTPTTPPTGTPAPSATPVPASATPVPASATPAPTLGFAETAISGWCVAPDTLLLDTADPSSPPAGALIGKMVGSAFQVDNLPSNGCVILYTFNQPAPAGLKLAVFDPNQKKSWLQTDLKPVDGKPNSVKATLRHGYIIAPPVWKISFTFAVQDASGKELRRDTVNFNRWTPKICWNGQPPNVNTLRCPLAEDLHPWDPSYRTPIPTYLPPDYWK